MEPAVPDDERAAYAREFGIGKLSKTLLENRLVDEYHVWVFPEVAGSGDRLFEGERSTLSLEGETRFKSGIVVLRYAPKD